MLRYLYFVLVLRWKTELHPRCVAVVIANVCIEGTVIGSDVYGFFYGPGHIINYSIYGYFICHRGHVTYGVAKEVARIVKPMTGNTIHHVNNSKEFADDMKKTRGEDGEHIISSDIFALFTSIPATSAIKIIKTKLQQDTELHKRTTMSAKKILELLEFCLCSIYFLFQGQFYEHTRGS